MTTIGLGPERLTENAVEHSLRVGAEDGAGDGWVDPIWALWEALPQRWRDPRIAGIPEWDGLPGWSEPPVLRLAGLPEPFAAELAWMAHWQHHVDGARVAIQPINQLALAIRRAHRQNRAVPASMQTMTPQAAERLLGWFYADRWGRLPPPPARARLRSLMQISRWALVAACHSGAWWELDDWVPRCDPRIPLGAREPRRQVRITPARVQLDWLRTAVKWHLGVRLQAGTLRWSTIGQARQLVRFDRWLRTTFDDPTQVISKADEAGRFAAAFARWVADPAHRSERPQDHRTRVGPRQVNSDLQAVAELLEFMADNRREAVEVFARLGVGLGPWPHVGDTASAWLRAQHRVARAPELNPNHYIDDHALAQITAAVPLLGLPRSQQMLIRRGDGSEVLAHGFGDPQAMRMFLLQILTGRRQNEIRACEFDCLSAAPTPGANPSSTSGAPPGPTSGPGGAGEVFRFRYAQSKIEIAPDTILVDAEVASIIGEQQRWIKENLQVAQPRYLFAQRISNAHGAKPYPPGTYNRWLREFSDLVKITDAAGRRVALNHTHRFRHTRLTRLAELGLPIKVLQRYAGHATPTMSMHYVAAREEHAEQAFLATAKLRADGTRVRFSAEDHDHLHLFERADRFLPNGWCMLPPLQTCDKGNACLTCSVFVTDDTHTEALGRQLAETTALIERSRDRFVQRHGREMAEDNVWLRQRRAEQQALTTLLATLNESPPGGALQGGGCPSAPAGPVSLELDLSRARSNPETEPDKDRS